MILVDYSQVCIANICQFQNDLEKSAETPEAVNIIRHAILTGLMSYKKKYGKKYGELVIACDGRNYWRKEKFPYYKINRKKARDSSSMDWNLIFDTMSQIKEDLITYFPYRIVSVDRAEADDIIATMCKYTQENELIDSGLFESCQPVLILSTDGDFKQLQKYDNVEQYSPQQKKFIVSSNVNHDLIEKICTGDAGDGVPNIMSPDAIFVTEGVRQTSFMKKKLEKFYLLGRDACDNDVQKRNWDRNNLMINLDMIPEDVRVDIITAYHGSKNTHDKMDIYNYLVKYRCRLLLENLENF